jgi:hypothetical protein
MQVHQSGGCNGQQMPTAGHWRDVLAWPVFAANGDASIETLPPDGQDEPILCFLHAASCVPIG